MALALSLGVAAFGIPAAALAGAGTTTTTIDALSSNVSFSTTSQPTQIGYEVSVRNDSGNTINAVRFTALLSVAGAPAQAVAATVEGIDPAACVLTATTVDCQLGQLRAGSSAPRFALFFRAPANASADPAATGQATLTGQTLFAEQTNGPKSTPPNSVEPPVANAVLLGTFDSFNVRSALSRAGGRFETASGADPISTAVVAPAGFFVLTGDGTQTTYSSVAIRESAQASQLNCANFVLCYQSDVTIPNTTFSPYLTVVLRMAAANIKRGTQIGSVLLGYVDDAGVEHAVGACASGPVARADGVPCVAKAVHYKNRGTPGWTAALDGSFEWTLINLKNGSYKVF